MRKDKDYIIQLRKNGLSYREIQKMTGISRGTLTSWLSRTEWSQSTAIHNNSAKSDRLRSNLPALLEARRESLARQYKYASIEAAQEYAKYITEPLFWAGLMIYAGEGDKSSKSIVRISNAQFHLHKIFHMFAVRYLGIKMEDIKCGLILTPEHNESLCREMWSNLLKVPRENFYKTQILQGKRPQKRLQYGVGMSIISSTVLKVKISKWLALAQDEKFEYAVMV